MASPKRLFQFQEGLPRLPVPTLAETLPRYLESVKPLLSDDEFAHTSRLVQEFPEGPGKRLQELLEKKAAAAKTSWLEDWWNNLAYLEYRDPICIWVNYCFVLKDEVAPPPSTSPQTSRAARMVYSALRFKELVESEALEPDMNRSTPLCSFQYPFLFNSCRIPRPVRDEMVSFQGSSHIVVARANRFFKVPVLDPSGRPLSPATIEGMLQDVVSMAGPGKEAAPVGLFTAEHRDNWAKIYEELEAHQGNQATLKMIQSAILMVCLDEEAPERLEEMSKLLLHSDAKNRWFDKQIQLIVFKNGKAGFNYEHARIDGLTTLRLTNYVYEKSQGLPMGERVPVNPPKEFSWALTPSLQSHLSTASKNVRALIEDNETHSVEFQAFGAKELKRLKMSPDSFVQVAFQLAYHQMNSRLAATYESASTKEFYHGRTEVVRSATNEALEFCRAMQSGSNVPLAKKKELLFKALEAHNSYMKFAKAAKGVDRHLFGLRLIGQDAGLAKAELFKDVGYTRTSNWVLSTSNCGSPNLRLFGFGPVIPEGYGLGYMIHDDAISVNVTAKASCRETSARLLAKNIENSFGDLHRLAGASLAKL